MTWSPATPEGQHVLTSADLSPLHWKAPLSRQQYFACCWPCDFVHLSVYETPNVQSLNFTCNQIETSGLQLQAFLVFEKDFFSSDAFVVPGRGMRNPDTISRPMDCCTFF